jgi:hypothetical protein
MRRLWIAAWIALAVYFLLVAIGAAIVTAGTGTLDGRATGWVAANLIAALMAGFAASRASIGAPRPWRFAVAIAGPLALSLLFTLTTHTRGPSGVWLATLATAVGAALGCALRDAIGSATSSPTPR